MVPATGQWCLSAR